MMKSFLIENKIEINENAINENDKIWNENIPINRYNLNTDIEKNISYGCFFLNIENYLCKNNFDVIKDIVFKKTRIDIFAKDIKKILVCLIKHGAFYHPCFVKVSFFNINSIDFILNVAVSDLGKSVIKDEFNFLKDIEKKSFSKHLPTAYNVGEIVESNQIFFIFTGSWFDDYHEFHLSYINGQKKIIVWDDKRGNYYLSSLQEKELYRQITMILVDCYDIKSCKQILLWHHAAGDFIVKCTDNFMNVKLITVRKYESYFKKNTTIESMFDTLLIFFLNISLKIRLDRLDGTGELIWSNDISVEGFISGFFESLAINKSMEFHKIATASLFGKYFITLDKEYLYEIIKEIVMLHDFEAHDIKFMMNHLKDHVDTLFEISQKFLSYHVK